MHLNAREPGGQRVGSQTLGTFCTLPNVECRTLAAACLALDVSLLSRWRATSAKQRRARGEEREAVMQNARAPRDHVRDQNGLGAAHGDPCEV